jgi:hypothetical protein
MADENKVNLSPKSAKSSKKEVGSPAKPDAVPGKLLERRKYI